MNYLAQIGRIAPPPELSKFGAGPGGLAAFLSLITRIVVSAAAAISLIFLIIGAIRFMTAGGDPKALSGARGQVVTAIVGLILVLVSLAIIALIEYFLQVDVLFRTA